VKDVLLGPEINLLNELFVHLLFELVLQLLCSFHAVLGRAEDAARLTLLILRQLHHFSFLQQALDQAASRRYCRLLPREPLQLTRQTVLLANSAPKTRNKQ